MKTQNPCQKSTLLPIYTASIDYRHSNVWRGTRFHVSQCVLSAASWTSINITTCSDHNYFCSSELIMYYNAWEIKLIKNKNTGTKIPQLNTSHQLVLWNIDMKFTLEIFCWVHVVSNLSPLQQSYLFSFTTSQDKLHLR